MKRTQQHIKKYKTKTKHKHFALIIDLILCSNIDFVEVLSLILMDWIEVKMWNDGCGCGYGYGFDVDWRVFMRPSYVDRYSMLYLGMDGWIRSIFFLFDCSSNDKED